LALTTRVTVCYQDRYGYKWCVSFHVDPSVVDPTDPVIVAIVEAINLLTNCVNISIELSTVTAPAGSATAAADFVNEDKGFFRFTDEDSVAHSYKIPGLKPGILSADDETIASTATGVPALISAVNTYAKGRGGADVRAFVSAYRKENRKVLRR